MPRGVFAGYGGHQNQPAPSSKQPQEAQFVNNIAHSKMDRQAIVAGTSQSDRLNQEIVELH